ncbi:MAG: MFS transporter [Pseudomonadota bacterium]
MSALRPVFSLIAAVWFLQLSGGLLGVVTPLGLVEMDVGTFGVGVIAGLYAAGFMAGAYVSPSIIGTLGNIRIFAAAAALSAIGALIQGLWLSEYAWAFIRFVQGATFAAMFASAEAWLGRAAPVESRGSVLGTYNVAAKAALLIAPVVFVGTSALQPQNYIWSGLFLAAALVPICITKQQEPLKVPVSRLPIVRMIRTSPSAVFGVFVAGVVNMGVLSLLPIYAAGISTGDTVAAAALAYAAANAGGLISQWPAGRISDKYERRFVIAAMAASAGLASLVLAVFGSVLNLEMTMLVFFLWGAGSLSFYGVCIAHGVDRVSETDVTAFMSTLLLVWAAGSVLGPVVAGAAMRSELGPSGLFAMAAVGLFALTTAMTIRRIGTDPVPDADQTDWQPVLPAGLPGGELDPRT